MRFLELHGKVLWRCKAEVVRDLGYSDIFASVFSDGRLPADWMVSKSIRRIKVRRTSVR